jgi:hypothetical protein
MIIATMKWTVPTVVFIGKDKTQRGKVKSSTHILRRWQNILTRIPGVIDHARNATTPFEAWSCLIKNEILDNITQHTSQYILSIRPKCSRESDAKLTDKIEVKYFIGLICLAGALRSNKQRLEELWGANGDGIEHFRIVMNHRRFRFLIRYVAE